MYNLQDNVDTPEQTFRISELFDYNRFDTPDATPTSSPAAEFGRSPHKSSRSILRKLHGHKHIPGSGGKIADPNSSAKSVVTFDFGKSDIASWHNFTLYLLMDSGEVYSLCPVLPFGAFVSLFFSVWMALTGRRSFE